MELHLHFPMCLHIVHRDTVLYLVTLLVFRAVGMSTRYVLGGSGFPIPLPPAIQVEGGGEVP